MIMHNTDMKIPISNTIYDSKNKFLKINKINIRTLNNLTFDKVDVKKFPSVKLINKCLNLGYLAPTIVNASNEVLVNLFLAKKIGFLDIVSNINKIIRHKDFKKYARRKPKAIYDIKVADKWARLKTLSMCVR
jgi:1-deoxy-D-xylulose-5-phosphate reductoisomerase|tara:strand:- start:67 stop:465 length:399 start_codon:yes stop_codon:yes gene_type:complete